MKTITRTIKTREYIIGKFNKETSKVENIRRVTLGEGKTERAFLAETKNSGLTYLGFEDIERRYECSVHDFLSVAHEIDNEQEEDDNE